MLTLLHALLFACVPLIERCCNGALHVDGNWLASCLYRFFCSVISSDRSDEPRSNIRQCTFDNLRHCCHGGYPLAGIYTDLRETV